MSFKAVGQSQQGRRTPLSLAGGKSHPQQQQNQSNANKMNYNSYNAAKNQEPRDSTKNYNQAAKNQHETRDLPPSQKDTKKTHQNGSKHVAMDNSKNNNVFAEQNGTANGTNNSSNGVSNKNNAKLGNQPPKNVEKEKEIVKEPEAVNEKPEQKSKKIDPTKVVEKNQNETNEKQAPSASSSNSNKSKDGTSTPTSNTPAIEKKQTSLPTKSNTSNNAHRKPSTPSKLETTTEKSAATPPAKSLAAAASSSNAQRKPGTPSKLETTEKSAATSPAKSSAAAASKATTNLPKATGAAAGSAVIAPSVKEKSVEVIEIHDNDIEPLVVDASPLKKSTARHAIAPTATSTPGKAVSGAGKHDNNAKSEIPLTTETRGSVDRKSVPRSYSDISGRRSIRSIDYTPSMYNAQYRESYRRINTELDVTGNTNTSMNVTVGSEIPNNSSFLSFSLFGRSRKRERTPPPAMPDKSQSAVELTVETTPPKRARLDVHGIFSAMSSPLTMLRTRFSKATLDTPAEGQQPSTIADDVQNVSGVSIEEVVSSAENTATENITVGKDSIAEKTPSKTTPVKEKGASEEKELQDVDVGVELAKEAAMDVDSDIKITETPIIPAVGEPKMKQRGCLIM